jgi:hypothetical protein
VPPETPLVIVANHPFGIGDGIALLALAEQLGRPYRILANSDIVKFPEIHHCMLPIDFSGSREAIKTNLESRKLARRLLQEGVTIVVFPAGGVATAGHPAGEAEELPWKAFTARLIQQAQAAVLPVYFEGQNKRLQPDDPARADGFRSAKFCWHNCQSSRRRLGSFHRSRMEGRPATAYAGALFAGPSVGPAGETSAARSASPAPARDTAPVSVGPAAVERGNLGRAAGAPWRDSVGQSAPIELSRKSASAVSAKIRSFAHSHTRL